VLEEILVLVDCLEAERIHDFPCASISVEGHPDGLVLWNKGSYVLPSGLGSSVVVIFLEWVTGSGGYRR
jgi:hypothetical protein